MRNWSPEIHIRSAEPRIERGDDLEIAWEKVKMGELNKYISSMGKGTWNENLSILIRNVLRIVAEM